uniref:Endonuclease-reverse transcriptase n=1 Tax=Cacopsylla melanoneura TaxID=428564 RepID=A0A8D8URH2_9HEMI
MQRSILGITWKDKISNNQLKEKITTKSIEKEARKLKWQWAGHVSRMDGERWTRKITEWTPRYLKRSRGRKTKRWRDELSKKAGNGWPTLARDRTMWRQVTKVSVEQ